MYTYQVLGLLFQGFVQPKYQFFFVVFGGGGGGVLVARYGKGCGLMFMDISIYLGLSVWVFLIFFFFFFLIFFFFFL